MTDLEKVLKEINRMKKGISRKRRREVWKDIWKVLRNDLEGETRLEKRRSWRAAWDKIAIR